MAAPTTATPVPSAPASADGTPTDPGPTDATATTEPTEESTSEPTDGPDPVGVFTVAYQDEPLRLQPSSRYIDLDQPSGNAPSAASELQYSGCPPAFRFLFGNVSLASVNSPTATANDCALQLRRAPVDPEFAPEKGQSVCGLTDREAADNEGIRQKIVLLRVVSIARTARSTSRCRPGPSPAEDARLSGRRGPGPGGGRAVAEAVGVGVGVGSGQEEAGRDEGPGDRGPVDLGGGAGRSGGWCSRRAYASAQRG